MSIECPTGSPPRPTGDGAGAGLPLRAGRRRTPGTQGAPPGELADRRRRPAADVVAAQRDAISPASVKDMKLLWKLQLDNQPRQMHNLFPPLIVSDVQTAQRTEADWRRRRRLRQRLRHRRRHRHADLEAALRQHRSRSRRGRGGAYVLCPGGLTATPVIGPGKAPGTYIVYAVSWDGRLRQLDVATGADAAPPELFLPPNGKPYGLNLYKNVIYTTTAQGCGGNPNEFYAYDLATKKVGSFNPASGGMWPRLGPSIGKDGSVYAGSGDGDYYPEQQIYGQTIIGVKQNPATKALELKDWFTPTNAVWLRKRDLDMNVTGPVFDYKGKEYIVRVEQGMPHVAARHERAGRRRPSHAGLPHAARLQRGSALRGGRAVGRARDLGRHRRHALDADAVLGAEALAVHRADRARRGRAAARLPPSRWRTRTASLVLAPAWLSRDMNQADPVVIANGVVFAYGNGEDATQAVGRHRACVQHGREPDRALDARGALRARRADRRGTVVERRPDRVLQSLHEPVGRQRPRLHRHVRRDALRLRRGPAGGDPMMPTRARGTADARGPDRGRLRHRLDAAGTRAVARMDDQRLRRAAYALGASRRTAHQGGHRGRRVHASSGRRSSPTRRGSSTR